MKDEEGRCWAYSRLVRDTLNLGSPQLYELAAHQLSNLRSGGSHYVYYPGQETNMPFALEGEKPLSSKVVCYVDILKETVHNKAVNAFCFGRQGEAQETNRGCLPVHHSACHIHLST